MLSLILPSVKYKNSFYIYLRELKKERRITVLRVKEIESVKFGEYIKELKEQSKGLHLPKNFVPSTEYWLVDKNIFIGTLRIRHKLNKELRETGGQIGYTISPSKRQKGYGKEILRLGLLKARKLGLNKVLITCDKTNIGSKKIIEANGGKLQNEFKERDSKIPKLRYWIQIQQRL